MKVAGFNLTIKKHPGELDYMMYLTVWIFFHPARGAYIGIDTKQILDPLETRSG